MSEHALDLESSVRRFLETRDLNPGTAIEARADLVGPIKDLNDLYWNRVEAVLVKIGELGPEQVQFSTDERICIDIGILDLRLLSGEAADIISRLVVELNYPGAPNQYYLTEWLKDRYRIHTSLQKGQAGASSAESRIRDLPEVCTKLFGIRLRIYHALHRFFENLPGIPTHVVATLMDGRLDATIQQLTLSHPLNRGFYSARCVGLQRIRKGIILKARQRCATDQQLAVFDTLQQADERLDQELLRLVPEVIESESVAEPPHGPGDSEGRANFLLAECRNVRSLIRLGTMGTGITRTHSVLLTDQDRLGKKELGGLLSQIHELDPHLPGNPDVMIAPFSGTGLYAWDRDTILLPLIPMKSPEESVLYAFANYRVIRDATDGRGRLKALWESAFPGSDFRKDFMREYRNWIVGVGRGFRGAMEAGPYEFFKNHIGPNAKELFAPVELLRLTPDERGELIKFCRRRIASGEATSADHYALAILHWREARYYESLQQITLATQLNPRDGRALFALGFMQKKLKDPESAAATLDAVGQVARNSIWNVFALEQRSSL